MKGQYVHIKDFCRGHNIDESFFIDLQEFELISLRKIKSQPVIHIEELPKVEKMIRLHRDLNINLEGIQVIHHLLEKTLKLQDEITMLRRQLNRYGDT